jgi:hypothetical protein
MEHRNTQAFDGIHCRLRRIPPCLLELDLNVKKLGIALYITALIILCEWLV